MLKTQITSLYYYENSFDFVDSLKSSCEFTVHTLRTAVIQGDWIYIVDKVLEKASLGK